MRSHRISFTVALTGISRALLLRDRVLGRVHPVVEEHTGPITVERHRIPSGKNVLDAVWVRPSPGQPPPKATILICHGIGETVEYWLPVQKILAASGAASLVFDYSGYGRSTGRIDARQCEDDAIAAFAFLQELAPGTGIAMLGFSLGSGIAAAVIGRVPASRLVLCAGFTSFRAAAHSVGVPARISKFIPRLFWQAEESLRDCRIPILVVHGDRDRLFPVRMAAELAACCGAEERIVPNLRHAEPYYRPQLAFWGPIVDWIERPRRR